LPRPVSNPPNPWATTFVEWIGPPPDARLEVWEERARTVLVRNESPDVSFRWGVNPYRGCQHACAYCYARRSHQWLSFGAGTDFEKRIVVKTNAPALLSRELARPALWGERVTFSGNTDCYQPLEAAYGLTRGCLEACLAFGNPVTIITKGALVRRDVDLLQALSRRAGAEVLVSIPFADERVARALEPGVGSPDARFETLRVLSDAGIATGVAIAPLVPALNDRDIPRLLERAAAAGARRAFLTLLRLPGEVLPVFRERLAAGLPERAPAVLAALDEARRGRLGESRFGERMRGHGERFGLAVQLFHAFGRRHGIATRLDGAVTDESDAGTSA
jgi:DNA repair photolyase